MAPRNWNFVVVIMVIVLANQVYGGFDDGDFQYWSCAKVRFDINKDWYGTVEEEFRMGDDAERLYYRHTDLGFVTSLELTPLKLKPYVADEIFLDLDQSGINRNRFYSGFSLKLSKNLSGDVYYLWQASNSDHQWNDIHVLGTQLEFRF